jgi:prevent-host-death family protein
MRKIQATKAKSDFASLLDKVERGETFIITRHGKPVARIVPETGRRQAKIEKALHDIEKLRKMTGKISLAEILSARHEATNTELYALIPPRRAAAAPRARRRRERSDARKSADRPVRA